MDSQLSLFNEVTNSDVTAENIAVHLKNLREAEKEPQLTMLSFGGGQDSFAMLYSFIHDKEFRSKYAPNDFIVVMSDTGNEHPYTYEAVKEAKKLCEDNNIHFMFLTPNMGYHTPGWQTLKDNMRRNKTILGASLNSKPCTASLKINVVDKYMYEWMCNKYGFEHKDNKKSWELYMKKFGTKARVIIGFAKDEEVRVLRSLKGHTFLPKYKQMYMQYTYPLIEEGWNRATAQKIILKYRDKIMPPSNCMICFYQSDHELMWLERFYPDEFADWVSLEKAKLDRFKDAPKNYGVYGAITLTEKLAKVKEKLGNLTDEQLWEYKLSHGHCVKSTF